jgi:hypothetical protein
LASGGVLAYRILIFKGANATPPRINNLKTMYAREWQIKRGPKLPTGFQLRINMQHYSGDSPPVSTCRIRVEQAQIRWDIQRAGIGITLDLITM